jgi:ER membrane protein complex subunit 1, C-terminal
MAHTITEQSYIFPHAITSIATTSTKYGISTKDIIGVSYLELAAARINVELIII